MLKKSSSVANEKAKSLEDIAVSENENSISVSVYLQPKASKTEYVGLYGDAIKLRVAAPPVDNAANQACIEFLAKRLDISKNNIQLISGESSRKKRFEIKGVSKVHFVKSLRAVSNS